MMGISNLPPEPPWFQEWALAAIRDRGVQNDLYRVHMFIEAVICDQASQDAGLWQGDMPLRAMESLLRVIELTLPAPSERNPAMTSPAEITNEERMARWLDDFAADRAHFGDCSINGFEFKRLRDAAQVIRRLSALSEGGDQLALTCERLLWLIETEWKKDGQYITVDARAALARYAPYRKGGE